MRAIDELNKGKCCLTCLQKFKTACCMLKLLHSCFLVVCLVHEIYNKAIVNSVATKRCSSAWLLCCLVCIKERRVSVLSLTISHIINSNSNNHLPPAHPFVPTANHIPIQLATCVIRFITRNPLNTPTIKMCTYKVVTFGCGCVKKAGELEWCPWAIQTQRECPDFQQSQDGETKVYVNCIECNS